MNTRRFATLVLSRKLGEKIFIGDDIVVTLVRNGSGQVRIGIDAPKDVAIVRKELKDKRLKKNPAA